MMGRLRETASFHRRLKNTEFISKKIPFPNKKMPVNNLVRKIKDPCLVEIRNKHTKELVDIEELVSTTQEKRNWRGIVIALLVIVTVLALIVTAILLVTPKTPDEKEGIKLDFRSFIKDEYIPRTFYPIWLPGSEMFLYRNRQDGVSEFNCEDNTTREVIDNSNFRQLNTKVFRMSADKKYILFQHDIHQIYRHSTIAKYTTVEIETGKPYELVGPHGNEFQHVQWSPVGHSLTFVQYNDIFYTTDPTDGGTDIVQLTFDGFDDIERIFNGVPDWVYEEEILQSDNAIWFSPNGQYLLYASFDDRDVDAYDMTVYGDLAKEYVMTRPLPYPKPGTPNPTVKIKVVDLPKNETLELFVPSAFQNVEHYVTMVSWQDNSHVLIAWMNRHQNVSILTVCNAAEGLCTQNLKVEADGGWVDMYTPAVFKPDGSQYFILLPHKDGPAGSYQHIAMVDSTIDSKSGEASKIFLTQGQWEVTEIVGYDDQSKTIYFLAVQNGDPTQRHLYSAPTQKDNADFRKTTCISCDVGEECLYVEASFTPTGKYYVLGCKGPAVPTYHLYSIDTGFVTTLEDNKELRKRVDSFMMPVQEIKKMPINDEETEFVWVKVLLPPILKKKEIIRYNILFRVYGAPNTQLVTQEFSISWDHYMCSVHSIIIVYVDGHGSGGRGNTWLHSTYKRLGTLEVDDTITIAKYFNSLHFVNEQSSAVWGLSFGGFMAGSVIGRGSGEFKCGMAIAPVTDWRYYDSVYTERYMGLPTAKDNLGGYNAANISKYASNFKSSNFMLIHGTSDDNVHFQNTAQLMKALVEEDVYFRQQIYPDQTHFLEGPPGAPSNTKTHLYNTMEDFVLNCYGKSTNYNEFHNDLSEKDIVVEDE